MTTVTSTLPSVLVPSPPTPTIAPSMRALDAAVADASDAVARTSLTDPRWETLGPRLTAFVDAALRRCELPGSPIEPDEVVASVVRLRDLGRLARMAAAATSAGAMSTPEIEQRLRSLQVEAGR